MLVWSQQTESSKAISKAKPEASVVVVSVALVSCRRATPTWSFNMGQALSRRIVPRLQKGMERYEKQMEQEIYRDIERKRRETGGKFTDTNAVLSGFRRGQGPLNPREEQQQQVLEEMQKPTESIDEMPEVGILSFALYMCHGLWL